MKPDFLKYFLTACLIFFSFAAFAQMPYSPCGPSGGKRADVLGVDVKYSSPGSSAPVFTIPSGTKSISIYISSETGITSGGSDYAQGDEDFITVNAIIDLASNTSSGYVNYAKNTNTDGSGTNVYGWQRTPLGAFIPAAAKIGDATPDLNNVNFTISGNTLTIIQSFSGIHSSFYVQYLSPYNNSLNLLAPQVKALLHGAASANTDLSMPIPADADIIFISGKGTNSSYEDLNTTSGTEEGYSNLRFTIDLEKGTTNGFITLANGGSANRRSTYVVNNLSTAYSGDLVSSGAAAGDYTGKSTNAGAVGLYKPRIYVSGGNLVIKRDASYARDFDDAYVVEFYKRTGQGMSAEFVNSDIKTIPKGFSSQSGVTRTFTIPPGTNALYFTETGNAVNTDRESNENSLEAYAYIDLATEKATGYFYQQVGLSLTERRDDNYAFKDVPLNNSSTRAHSNTAGFKGPYNYDISFSLSADKSQLTVTTKTGLANPDYQLLLSADYYGSKPDIAFGTPAVTFTKVDGSKIVKANVAVCNPGSGNSNGGMPVSFYQGDPTASATARLLYTGAFPQEIRAGECKNFSFDLDLSSFDNLNMNITIIINDDGSYAPGGVGHTVSAPFTLDQLANQHSTYQECYYGNNLVTQNTAVNNAPIVDPDPDNSSGATGSYNYRNVFNAGSTGAKIMDADLTIIDPDASNLFAATVTLTNTPDAGNEGLYLNGTLPAGISISGNNTNVVKLSGQASQSDYIAALKMLEYRNSNRSPNTNGRIVTATVNDGTEYGPVSTTTIAILTSPRINVMGNAIDIADNSTTVSITDGTSFGMAATGVIAHTFFIHNTGTGVLSLTASPAVSVTGDGFSITKQPGQSSMISGGGSDLVISFDPGTRQGGVYTAIVHILNNDPDAGRSDYTFTVSATINNAPTVTDNSAAGYEDQPLALTAAAFANAYHDADGAALSIVKILSLPLNGILSLNGAPVTIGTEVSLSSLANLTFTPAADWNGQTGFDWSASDALDYSATAHMAIDIAPVNDAPTGTGDTKTTNEDTPINGAVTGSDIDNDPLTFTKASNPSHGSAIVNTDGTYTYTPNTSYNGSDNFTIQINDGNGGTVNVTVNLTVLPVNDAPTGTGDTKTTNEETPVNGAVTGSDIDSDPLTFTKATDPSHGSAMVNPDGSYIYTPNTNYNGPDNFTIDINDGNGGTVNVTVNLTVLPVNDAPTGTGDTKTTNENTPVNGTVTGSDIDSDPLTFTKATSPSHGTAVVNTDGTYTYTPNTSYNGPDNFNIQISDGNGGTVTVAVNITVLPVNDAPTGTGDTKITNENTPVNGTVTGSDIDSDPLTFTKATSPSHGSAVVNTDGTYTYIPNTSYNGPDNFTIEISDGNGGTTTVTVNITVIPVNDAPTGTGDTKTTNENTPVNGIVTGSDIDRDPLTFTKATDPSHGTAVVNTDGTYTYTPNTSYNGPDIFTIEISDGNGGTTAVTVNITVVPVNDAPTGTGDTKSTNENTPVNSAVTGSDIDNDPLTFTKATSPSHGSAVVNTDGTYTYTPNASYNGPDNFTIEINDGNGGTTAVTVNITVVPVNDAPTGTGDTKTTNENTPVNGIVTGSDIDRDPLTFTKATDPSHGTAVVNTDGTFTYTPNTNYNGPDNFTIEISDGNGGTAIVAVNLTVLPVNDAPTGTGDTKSTNEDTPVSGAVTGSDIDRDPLTFTKATNPSHGSAVVNTDGTYTYTPNTSYHGPDNFTIEINDGNGGTTTVTVSLTVLPVNDAPTGAGDTKTTNENTPVNGAVTGSDIDNDPLTFTKASNPSHGSAIVNTDGTYTYTPNTSYNGPDNFTIEISDGNGSTTTVTVNLTVLPVNDAPTGTGDTKTTNENTPVNGAVTGSDIDNDPLTFTKASNPSHGSAIVNTDGTYTYTPNTNYNGPDNFNIQINDGNGGTTVVTVNITVVPVNDMPTGRGDAKVTAEDTPVSGAVTGQTADHATLFFTKATDPAHGNVIVNNDGTYSYTPDTNYNGTDNFTITISNHKGGATTVTVNILVTPVNDIPAGTGDTKTTNENTPVNGAVTGSDIDSDPLTFTKAGNPSHGSAIVNTDGTYTYTPNASYNGPDNFTIAISDGHGGTATVTVNITVLPAAAPASGSITLVKTGILRTDNISITYVLTATNTGNVTLHNVTITDPMLGMNKTLAGDLQPGATASITAVYRLTPEDREQGRVSNTALVKGLTPANTEVTDRSGTTGSNDEPTLTEVSGLPLAVNDAADTRMNTPVTVPVLDNDNAGLSAFNKAGVRIMSAPVHGRVTTSGDGTVMYMPGSGYTGEDIFTYSAQDMDGYQTNIAVVKLVISAGDIKIPTLFTPNGDGKNDVFEIRGLQQYAENELVMFNRWGNEVYRQKNYQNSWRGDGLAEGTYYYLLRIKKTNTAEWEVLKGYTTLLRTFKQ